MEIVIDGKVKVKSLNCIGYEIYWCVENFEGKIIEKIN